MELLRLAVVLGLALAALVAVLRLLLTGNQMRSTVMQIGVGSAVGALGAVAILATRMDVLPEDVESVLGQALLIVGSCLVLGFGIIRIASHVRRD